MSPAKVAAVPLSILSRAIPPHHSASSTKCRIRCRPADPATASSITPGAGCLRQTSTNYAHGSIVVYAINSDGSLGRVADSRSFGSELQPSHAHCGVFAPGNRHAFVCDLGLDGIHQFSFDDATGKLREHEDEPFVRSSKGSGPRHIAFHPNGVAAYVINEKDSTVDTFSYIQVFGRLVRHQTLSSLPPGFEGESYCAEIKVSSDGRHVYGSNRGISSNQEVPEHVRFYRLD
jgi:6-phosphogluconolactonase